ncbi:MAG: Zn-dependent hydrolase [Acidobacteria bacterium]|nr:Zn-dependent hydrolase [Acidobacteriota bacterium]
MPKLLTLAALWIVLIGTWLAQPAETSSSTLIAQMNVARARQGQGRQVVSDLNQRLAKWHPVKISSGSAGLSSRELQMIEKLTEALHHLEEIYWRQSDPEGLKLYQSLRGARNAAEQKLRRFLLINGSRFDLLDENKPFVGTEPFPPGRGLYPKGITGKRLEQYVKRHPDKKGEIFSPYTIVRRNGNEFEGVSYHIVYRSFLEPAAKALQDVAALSEDPSFAKFLRLRADALLTDDYYNSDLAWLDLKNPKFDLIFAPYETYLDGVLGIKTSYGAAILIRNDAESSKLALFQKYVADIQDALPLAPEDRPSKRGHLSPMEVMDAPLRAGDLRHGYQAVADNLPNDPRIHQEKGSKKIFFKNFMDARVEYVIVPLAKHLMWSDQASIVSSEGYLAGVIMHEIAHGLGPTYARKGVAKVDIRQALGPVFSALEEAKADVVGMYGLKLLVDRGILPKTRLTEYYASYVAGIFRTVRYGTGEAHGRAELMEFNYLSEQKALTRDPSGRHGIDYSKIAPALEQLSKELLTIEATGDRARAEEWFHRYEKVPPELKSALQAAADVPVDIDPVFALGSGSDE